MSRRKASEAFCTTRTRYGVLALSVTVIALLATSCGGGGANQGEEPGAMTESPAAVIAPDLVLPSSPAPTPEVPPSPAPAPVPTPTPSPTPALPSLPHTSVLPDLNRHLPPSGNFDLTHWKLTLPSGSEISPTELNSGYARSDAFYTDAETGGMVFRSPNIAGTTPNSRYSRSELREMRAPEGPTRAAPNNWTTDDGGTLNATLRIDHVSNTGESSKVGRVIVGQIHGEGAEPVRLYYHKRPHETRGRIYAGLDSSANVNAWSPDIVPNDDGRGIALGEVFSYRIKLTGLQLEVEVSTSDGSKETLVIRIDRGYERTHLYFKAGVYNQNNTGDASDYVQATFFALRSLH